MDRHAGCQHPLAASAKDPRPLRRSASLPRIRPFSDSELLQICRSPAGIRFAHFEHKETVGTEDRVRSGNRRARSGPVILQERSPRLALREQERRAIRRELRAADRRAASSVRGASGPRTTPLSASIGSAQALDWLSTRIGQDDAGGGCGATGNLSNCAWDWRAGVPAGAEARLEQEFAQTAACHYRPCWSKGTDLPSLRRRARSGARLAEFGYQARPGRHPAERSTAGAVATSSSCQEEHAPAVGTPGESLDRRCVPGQPHRLASLRRHDV